MMYGYNEEMDLNLRDSLRGIVTKQKYSGLCIDLQIDEEEEPIQVFGYWTNPVKIGTEVICSIKRWAKEGKDILVTIDSVGDEYALEMTA